MWLSKEKYDSMIKRIRTLENTVTTLKDGNQDLQATLERLERRLKANTERIEEYEEALAQEG